jgi:exodeoxyribonuclease VII small subunit
MKEKDDGSGGPNEAKPARFEECFIAAERAVEALERGELPLDDALRRYEEGLRALHSCYEILQRTQRRIEVLGEEVGSVGDGPEGPEWRPAASFGLLAEALAAIDSRGRSPTKDGAPSEARGRAAE